MTQVFDMKGLDAQQILTALEQRDLRDRVIDAKDLAVAEVNFDEGFIVLEERGYSGTQEHILNERASSQLLSRITPRWGQFPKHYIDDPDLQAQVIDHRLQRFAASPPRKDDSMLLLRAFRGHGDKHYLTRACLTSRYATYNHEKILGRILETFPDLALTRAMAGWDDMFLTFEVPGEQPIEIREGDVVSAGISVFNGETGNRSLGFEDFTMRLVCSNGLRRRHTESGTRFRHVGNLLDAKVDAGMTSALNNIFRTPQLMGVASGMEIKIDNEKGVKPVYAEIVKRAKLPKSFLGSFEKAHGEDELDTNDVSLLGIVNGVTRTARDEKNMYRQVELEELAGAILIDPSKYGIQITAA